jgi:DnaJ-class molecular chaperone
MSDGGKGSAPRPLSVDSGTFQDNWERTFGWRKRQIADELPITMEPDEDDDIELVEDDEDDICSGCSGSGEGMYDGSTCKKCHGCGVEPVEKDDDV